MEYSSTVESEVQTISVAVKKLRKIKLDEISYIHCFNKASKGSN